MGPVCLLLASLANSALFAGAGEVWVGRAWVEGQRLEALVVTPQGAYALGDAETDEGLYSLAPIPEGYVAVGFSGPQALVVWLGRDGTPRKALRAGPGMLWFTDGRYAVGGLQGPDWDVWVLRLSDLRGWRYPALGEAYAYGAYWDGQALQVVGRTRGAGGFDGFWLRLGPGGEAQGYQSGFPGNDYLRFVGPLGAVGRAEVAGDSEGAWLFPQVRRGVLWRRPGLDYFRMVRGYGLAWVLVGEAEVAGERRGLWLQGQRAWAAGPGLSALRFLDAQHPVAYGFSYAQSLEGQGWVQQGPLPEPLKYRLEVWRLSPQALRWQPEAVRLNWQGLGGVRPLLLPEQPCQGALQESSNFFRASAAGLPMFSGYTSQNRRRSSRPWMRKARRLPTRTLGRTTTLETMPTPAPSNTSRLVTSWLSVWKTGLICSPACSRAAPNTR